MSSFSRLIRHEFINESAIATELFNAVIELRSEIESLPGGDCTTPIHDALGWRYTRFGKQATEPLEAALFKNEDGSYWQAKLSRPRIDKGKSRKAFAQALKLSESAIDAQFLDLVKQHPHLVSHSKYEAPVGNGSRLFLPPVPAEIRQRVSDRYGVNVPPDRSFWDWVAEHPELPLIPTEGGKKALAPLSFGYIPLALYGVNSGLSKYRDGARLAKPELIPDLKRFAVRGRPLIFAFDQDTKPATKSKVWGALADLGYHLQRSGCQVKVASWDSQGGRCKGLDDLIANAGAEAWQASYDNAQSWKNWSQEHRHWKELPRIPDLHIGHDEFVDHASQFPRQGILALWGNRGSGKGKAVKQLLQGRRWLSVTTLRSLGRDQAESWDGAFVNSGDRYGDRFLKDGSPVDGGSVCIPSLLKVRQIRADVFILDELPATLKFLHSSKLANKQGIRPLLIEELKRRIREARLVILASSDLKEEHLRWVEEIRNERTYLIRSDRQPLNYLVNLLLGTKDQAVASFIETAQENAQQEKITLLHADSKALVKAIAADLNSLGCPALAIHEQSSGDPIIASLLASKGDDFPRLLSMGIRAIVMSPSVKEGVSFEKNTHLIGGIWSIIEGCSIGAEEIVQQPDRTRCMIPRHIWIAEHGRNYSKLSRGQFTALVMRDIKCSQSALARLTRHSLSIEAIAKVDCMDWENPDLRLLASFEAQRNRDMANLRERVTELLKREGKQIYYVSLDNDPSETKTRLKAHRRELEEQHAQAVAAAQSLNESEADALERKENLSPDEMLSLERYYLEKFYRSESITVDEILWDKDGKRRNQIRNLEQILNPELAQQASSSSIEENDCPQDWHKAKLQIELLEQSGAADLIRDAYHGRIQDIPKERVEAIAQFMKEHPKEFYLALNFSHVEKVSANQIVGQVFDWCGLARHSRQARVNGKITRIYSLDSENLAIVKSIVNRRSQAVTPPENDQLIGGGVTGQNPLENPPEIPPENTNLPTPDPNSWQPTSPPRGIPTAIAS